MSAANSTTVPAQTDNHPTWVSQGETTPSTADALHDWLEKKPLSKGDDYKIDPRVDGVKMGLSWDSGFDIDASAVMFTQDGTYMDAACFKQLKSKCGSMVHSGDETTGEVIGDDEQISVELDKVPWKADHILFLVSMLSPSHSFKNVSRASVRMLYGTEGTKGDELFEFELTKMDGNAVLMGQLTRKSGYWCFKALGESIGGNSIRDLIQGDERHQFLASYPVDPPPRRKVTATVLKGKKLMAKDAGFGFFKKPSSDPFYIARFKEKEYKSEYISKNLEPVWNEEAFELDNITEKEAKTFEVQLFDYDAIGANDFMGEIRVRGGALFDLGCGTHHYWFDLRRSEDSKFKDHEVSGQILIRFNIDDVPDTRPS